MRRARSAQSKWCTVLALVSLLAVLTLFWYQHEEIAPVAGTNTASSHLTNENPDPSPSQDNSKGVSVSTPGSDSELATLLHKELLEKEKLKAQVGEAEAREKATLREQHATLVISEAEQKILKMEQEAKEKKEQWRNAIKAMNIKVSEAESKAQELQEKLIREMEQTRQLAAAVDTSRKEVKTANIQKPEVTPCNCPKVSTEDPKPCSKDRRQDDVARGSGGGGGGGVGEQTSDIVSIEVDLMGTSGLDARAAVRRVNTFRAQHQEDKGAAAQQNFMLVNGGVISGVKRGADFYGNSIQGAEWMQMNYEPSVGCANEIRIGDIGDGGKWICPNLIRKNNCTVLSLGIGGNAFKDTSFERVLAQEYGCEVHAFDHTQPYSPAVNYYTYHKLGLGPYDEPAKMLTTLPKMAEFFKQPCCTILKLDVEGHEFEAFEKSEENRNFLNQVPALLVLTGIWCAVQGAENTKSVVFLLRAIVFQCVAFQDMMEVLRKLAKLMCFR